MRAVFWVNDLRLHLSAFEICHCRVSSLYAMKSPLVISHFLPRHLSIIFAYSTMRFCVNFILFLFGLDILFLFGLATTNYKDKQWAILYND